VLKRAAEHKGSAFIEIYQNCNVFNDHAFAGFTAKDVKHDNQIRIEHGQPLIFGKEKNRGIRLGGPNGLTPEVVEIGVDGVTVDDIAVYDEKDESGVLAYLLSRIEQPEFPVPIGVFRSVERPIYDSLAAAQLDTAKETRGEGDIMKMLYSGDTWDVK